ncbi:hypothetical protein CVT26_014499 [Gymnopilus dilepis]|uniref:Uncharacterized protein n=1 Tax=Gymnopilus dilepis TaxID=231916 RepID=A0A409X1Q8_9AGAR|nr:hypothetical protein CVT26_014499 [Gymnopilus dilepis]
MSTSERIVGAILDQLENKIRDMCANPERLQAQKQNLLYDLREANNLIKATQWPYYNICTVLNETFRKASHELRTVRADEIVSSLQLYDRIKRSKIEKWRSQHETLTITQETMKHRHISQQERTAHPALPPGTHKPGERGIHKVVSERQESDSRQRTKDGPQDGELMKKNLNMMPGRPFLEDPIAGMKNRSSRCTIRSCSEGNLFLENTARKISNEFDQNAKEEQPGGDNLGHRPSKGELPTLNQHSTLVPRRKSEPVLFSPATVSAPNGAKGETSGKRKRAELPSRLNDAHPGQKRRRENYWDSSGTCFNHRMLTPPPGESCLEKQTNTRGGIPTCANDFRDASIGTSSDKGSDHPRERGSLAEKSGREGESSSTEVLHALRNMTQIVMSLHQEKGG